MPKVHGYVFMPENKIIIVADRPHKAEAEGQVTLTVLDQKELEELVAEAEKRGENRAQLNMHAEFSSAGL